MANFTSRELYMMNSGKLLYIFKDGFGDVYKAAPAEEARWAEETVEKALEIIAAETNKVSLQMAVADLVYHKYDGISALLLNILQKSSLEKKLIVAALLWNMEQYENSFDLIIDLLKQHQPRFFDKVFDDFNDFKEHEAAKYFLVSCLQGNEEEWKIKAQNLIEIWAWSGMPKLRENDLLRRLQIDSKNNDSFKAAIESLKEILKLENMD